MIDYLWFAVSLVITAIQNLGLVLKAAAPFVVIIGLFGSFVFWNGGVVLGACQILRSIAQSADVHRGQIQPHRHSAFPANALYLAVHHLFLLSDHRALCHVSNTRPPAIERIH